MRATPAVVITDLCKAFHVRRPRAGGFAARLQDFVRPHTQTVTAVDRLSFSIAPGERVAFVGPNGAGKSTTLKMLAGILQPDAGEVRVLGLEPSRQRHELAFRVGTVFGQRSQLWYQLSLGERMRCEIAASLLHAPRILFLDEPTIGLDVSAKAVIRELLHTESASHGVTLLLTSHDTADIE